MPVVHVKSPEIEAADAQSSGYTGRCVGGPLDGQPLHSAHIFHMVVEGASFTNYAFNLKKREWHVV
jgi:hypothetical protein